MLRKVVSAAICGLAIAATFSPALACRQALILGLDVSSSVDWTEYKLQKHGLALALTDPQVMDVMIGPPGNQIELLIFEWSGLDHQNLLLDWTTIDSPATLAAIAAGVSTSPPSITARLTGIGRAMLYARDRFLERPDCAVQTLDLSGDGKNNDGIAPEKIRPDMAAAGIVVNGLVIGIDQSGVHFGEDNIAELSAYYRTRVIVGASAFVETALGFEDYAEAIKRKLVREMLPAMAGRDPPMRQHPI